MAFRAQSILCCGALVLLGSVLQPPLLAKNKTYSFKQPFALTGQVGFGSNPIEGMLLLDPNQEQPFASRVLLQTLQESLFSVVDPSSDLKTPLLPQRNYKTDIVLQTDDVVKDYNVKNGGALGLDPALYYGLQFEIRYQINTDRERCFYIQVGPTLYYKGAASPKWRDYKGAYAGGFFADRFFETLRQNFKNIKPGRELAPR